MGRRLRSRDRHEDVRSVSAAERAAAEVRVRAGPRRGGGQDTAGQRVNGPAVAVGAKPTIPAHANIYQTREGARLLTNKDRAGHWNRWGPFLAERAWGTVREDYSANGDAWDYFPHDHARSKAYRWNEDGLGGICDRHQYLCFALALWNGRDPFLKERLFGLTGPQGNHGEDVKEYYFYLDSTPTHSYMKYLYKYPQAEFPYAKLVEENRRRTRRDLE